MAAFRFLLFVLSWLLLCLSSTWASPDHAHRLLQRDEGSSHAYVTTAGPLTTHATIAIRAPSGTMLQLSLTSSPTSTATNDPTLSNSNNTSTNDPALPIQPEITPALAIAGVILIATGTLYTLVGVRSRWMYISLGSAYVTALAVVVLIVYVAVPPVSNAIQGAYFVAIFFTGLILGGLSLIFTEITECLGSIFGGFCIAMWLLVLKSGGLISSSGGKVALILSCCAIALLASFSRWTKTYVTIGSTSFAGATVLVLGIDCFSRAGLKEFWVYIWGLNRQLFPLGTTTFPLTRGIQAEVACIVIISLFGLMSQSKLWKIVRQRRAEKQAEDDAERRGLDHLDESIGRRIENITNRQRAQWESVYGEAALYKNASSYQSTTDSISKSSVSVKEGYQPSHNSMELEELEKIKTGSQVALVPKASSMPPPVPRVTVHMVDDYTGYVDRRVGRMEADVSAGPSLSDVRSSRPSSTAIRPVSILKNKHVQPTAPTVTPLPFVVPVAEEEAEDNDAASAATAADSEADDVGTAGHISERLARRTSHLEAPSSTVAPAGHAADFGVPHNEDDRASSVAATVDDLTDDESASLPDLSVPSSPFPDEHEGTSTRPSSIRNGSSDRSVKEGAAELSQDIEPRVYMAGAVQGGSETIEEIQREDDAEETKSQKRHGTSVTSARRKSFTSNAPTELSEHGENGEAVKRQLSSRLSKVAMSYRTNEWAKHLGSADKPDLDDLKDQPVVPLTNATGVVEVAAPVNVEDLQRTAGSASMEITSRNSSVISQTNRSRPQSNIIVPNPVANPRMSVASQATPHPLISQSSLPNLANYRASQQPDPQLASARSSMALPHGLARSSSQPLLFSRAVRRGSIPLVAQTLIESPIEEAAAEQERALSRANTITASSVRTSYHTGYGAAAPLHDAGSIYNTRFNDDNMSLSSRKKMIDADNAALGHQRDLMQTQQQFPLYQQVAQYQNQQRQSLSQQNSYPQLLQQSQPRLQQPSDWALQQPFDSHQPQRGGPPRDNNKREALLATWRNSVRQELNMPGTGAGNSFGGVVAASTPAIDERRRQAMLQDKWQTQFAARQQAAARDYRDEMFDQMMRRGDMRDLHAEAMRKMQAGASGAN